MPFLPTPFPAQKQHALTNALMEQIDAMRTTQKPAETMIPIPVLSGETRKHAQTAVLMGLVLKALSAEQILTAEQTIGQETLTAMETMFTESIKAMPATTLERFQAIVPQAHKLNYITPATPIKPARTEAV